MKTKYTIGMSFAFLILSIPIFACDACGGIAINQNDNDFSFTNKISYSGSWNRYKIFRQNDQSSYDQYSFFSNQLNGTYAVKSKVQFGLVLPLNGIVMQSNNKMHNWGLGDISLSVYANILDIENVEKSLKHNLNSGVGMTFPTGKRANSTETTSENLSLRLSAESWSWFAKLDYVLQIKKWSIAQINSVSLYAKNKNNYRFGNIYNHGLRIQLQIPLNSNEMNFHPFIITTFEHANENLHNNFIREFTGYKMLSLSGGLTWSINKNNLSFVYRQVLWQKQNNNLLKKQNGIMLSYAFKFN